MLANVKFRIFLSPVTIQCDDLGLREAGITCNVASDSSEVKLFHHVLDVPLYEIMRRRALGKVLMHSTGLSTYALNCEIGTFLRREFEVGVSRLDWAQFAEFRLATPDLEYRWHIVRLGPEQECVGRHIPFAHQMEGTIEPVHDRCLAERPWQNERNYAGLASSMVKESDCCAGVLSKRRIADDCNWSVSFDYNLEKVGVNDTRVFRVRTH